MMDSRPRLHGGRLFAGKRGAVSVFTGGQVLRGDDGGGGAHERHPYG